MTRREVHLEPGTPVQLESLRTGRRVACTVGKLLGEGGTALVFSGALEDGTTVVLKIQRWAGEVDPAFEHEMGLFGKLAHRNVVHCVGAGEVDGFRVLGFRRAYDNPLLLLARAALAEELQRDHRARYPSLPLDTAIDLAYELINALEYLERIELVHHDVKLANLLIDPGPRDSPLASSRIFGVVVRRQYRAVLIDFGATRSVSYLQAWNRGLPAEGPQPQITPFYAPPESVVEARREDGELGYRFDPTLDVYAAALVIYAMITGHPPYNHMREPPRPDDLEALVGVKSAERRGEVCPIAVDTIRRVVLDGLKLKIDRAEFDAGLYRLLAKRLDPDPAKRGTAAELKRDFEKFARIRKTPATLDPPGKRRARVALPFTQELVEPAQGEHPLLKAARLCGELERDEEEGTGSGSKPRPRARGSRRTTRPAARLTRRIPAAEPGGGPQAAGARPAGGKPRPNPRPSGRIKPPAPKHRPAPPAASPRASGQRGGSGTAKGSRRPAASSERAPRQPAPTKTDDPLLARGYPDAALAAAPHCLISAVLDHPFLLSRERARITVGRAADADVRIVSDRVSRAHAELRWDGRAFVVTDKGSTNGTEVNGHPVPGTCVLHPNDRVTFGGFEFELRVVAGDAPPEDLADAKTRPASAAPDLSALAVPDLTGVLGHLDLRDVIEVLEWKKRSGTLRIEPPKGPPGALFLNGGRIVHATRGKGDGLNAALSLLRVKAGRFVFTPGRPQVPSSLDGLENDQLLERAARS